MKEAQFLMSHSASRGAEISYLLHANFVKQLQEKLSETFSLSRKLHQAGSRCQLEEDPWLYPSFGFLVSLTSASSPSSWEPSEAVLSKKEEEVWSSTSGGKTKTSHSIVNWSEPQVSWELSGTRKKPPRLRYWCQSIPKSHFIINYSLDWASLSISPEYGMVEWSKKWQWR